MADNTIDTLELQIKSSSNQADKALDRLSASLLGLSKSAKRMNSSLPSALESIKSISKSIGGISNFKTPDFSGLVTEFGKLKNIDVSKSVTSLVSSFARLANAGDKASITVKALPEISNSLVKAVNSLNDIGDVSKPINTFVSSFARLSNAGEKAKITSQNFEAILSGLTKGASDISDIGDIDSGINRFVSSIARLSNAGDKSTIVAQQLPILGKALNHVIKDMSQANQVSDSVNMFVQSIGRLASAGNKTGQTAGQLKNLANETLEFFRTMQKAPAISENTIRMTQALAQLATAGGKVGTATRTITGAFNKLSSVGNKTFSVIKKVANGLVSSFKKIGNSSEHVNKASSNLRTLLKTALGFGAIRGLFNFGKSMIETGSDLEEVQNVVRVAFGNMSGMVDEFAKTSSEKFGLSELAAKQYSGTMMAMLKSSGVVKESAAEMSTTLAGLAGDIASFYNIDTDDAFSKIRSGIAGEIEPLRQLGVSMTVANLEAYALANGISKTYREMTQAEQVMLRYNYLMWATSDAQGDFVRTSDNYANQLRMLKLNFQQLSATIGQGLIAAVLPVIQVLNALLGKLMQVATAFKNFIYTLMGKKIESPAGGIVQDVSGIESAGNDAASGLGNAADAAGELKKKLSVLPFDQLNQLADNSEKAGGGGGTGGGAGGDYGFGDLSDAMEELGNHDVEGPISKWAKRIRDAFLNENWEKLGFEIADGLNRGMQKIYDVISWKNVGPKITKFVKSFTRTMNSLVSNIEWDLMGRTIGSGFTTIVKTLNLLIKNIRWQNLGKKFSEGVMGIASAVDWKEFGDLIGNKFMILWDVMYGFITGLDFSVLGTKFATGLKSMISAIDFQTITDTLVGGFNGIFDFLKSFNAMQPFEGLGEKISNAINTSLQELDAAEAGETLSNFVTGILTELVTIAQETDWELFGRKIGEFLSNIDWWGILTQVGTIIWEAFSGMISGLFDTSAGKVFLAFVVGLKGLQGAFKLVDLATSASEWIGKVKQHLLKLPTTIDTDVNPKTKKSIGKIAGEGGLFSKLASGAKTAVSKAGPILTSIGKVIFSPKGALIGAIAIGVGLIIGHWDEIKQAASDLAGWVGDRFEDIKEGACWLGEQAIEPIKQLAEGAEIIWKNLDEDSYEKWENMKSTISGALDIIASKTNESTSEMDGTVSESWENMERGTSETWSSIIGTVSEKAKEMSDTIGHIPEETYSTGKEIPENLVSGINNASQTAFDTVKEFGENIISKFQTQMGIGTTSDVFFDFGQDTVQGYIDGTDNKKGSAVDNLSNLATDSVESFNGIDVKFSNIGSEMISELDIGISRNVSKVTRQIMSMINKMLNSFKGLDKQFSKIGSGLMDSLNSGILSYTAVVAGSFDKIVRVANEISNDMYEAGKNAGRSFANGFKSIHIPTPHLDVSRYNQYTFGDSKVSIPDFRVNWYKTGGLFSKASLIGVGEAGREAVLPLENKRAMSMIADSIMSNTKSSSLDEKMLENAVARGFAIAMMNNQQNPVNVTCYAELRTENDEVLARAVTRGQKKIDYRMNPTPQFG